MDNANGKPSGLDRQMLLSLFGNDPENSVIDCRPDPAFNTVSDNFRITVADVARFIMELKQVEVA